LTLWNPRVGPAKRMVLIFILFSYNLLVSFCIVIVLLKNIFYSKIYLNNNSKKLFLILLH
jgi:hypothetical protein